MFANWCRSRSSSDLLDLMDWVDLGAGDARGGGDWVERGVAAFTVGAR